MSFENDILNKLSLINSKIEDQDKKRKQKAEELLELAKNKLVENIDEEALKEGKVIYRTEFLFPLGDKEIDLIYLAKICNESMVYVDWSHPTPTGREFTFKLNIEQFVQRSGMTLKLK